MSNILEIIWKQLESSKSKSEKRKILRFLALTEAKFNLDLLNVLKLSKVKDCEQNTQKVLKCFRSRCSEAILVSCMNFQDVFNGGPAADQTNLFTDKLKGDRFKIHSELQLYSFCSRKIEILQQLAVNDFKFNGTLLLKVRFRHLGERLLLLINSLSQN